MSWIVAGVIAASTAYGAYKGGQQADAYEDAVTAAGQIKQEKVGILGEQKELGLAATQSTFSAGQRNIGMGVNMGLRRVQAFGEQAYSQSNLATSGTIEKKVETQTGDLMAKYKSDMTKLFETRDLSRTEADLSYRKGELSAEEAYQNQLSSMDEGGAWEGAAEGFFSSIGSAV